MNAWTRTIGVTALLFISSYSTGTPSSRAHGATLYQDYCSGCHSLKYLSWSQISDDLHLSEHQQRNTTSMTTQDARTWFGKPPPDLSLISKQRGHQWLKNYLQGFYPDPQQRFGMNNHLLPNVMMPNILESAQHNLTPKEFKTMINDIVNFLDYAADPSILLRFKLGWRVLSVLIIGTILLGLKLRQRSL